VVEIYIGFIKFDVIRLVSNENNVQVYLNTQ